MSPVSPAFFCIGPLPKPSLQAHPSSLVPLKHSVTLRCQGPSDVDSYRLEKLKSGQYEDQDFLFIATMKMNNAGRYRCSYQNGSLWSPPSDQLELIAISAFTEPSLSVHPSSTVTPGSDVTLTCNTQYGYDGFALYKDGDTRLYKRLESWYRANFPIITVTATHSGTYRCYSFSSTSPYLWSSPSNPIVLVVTGPSATPSQVPTEAPSPTTEASPVNKLSTTEKSMNITISPEVSSPPFGFAHQKYVKGNLVRICLGATIIVFLVGVLAEDWHSRKKRRPHRIRAVQRPLPPLPLS
ncbi:platelet glycoprotein VI [Acomys russatus]|uniref:platelet glycoprotein VI n=1 Tax=Acomys russatus TaxID=60746 RepID=UPI0021E1F3B3|nr:platelet glycoprotein VI [Acomys russatus]